MKVLELLFDCSDADSIVTVRPPQLAITSATTTPPPNRKTVSIFKCDRPNSEHDTHTQRAVTDAGSTSQVWRRSLTSTTGLQRNMKMGGSWRSAPMRAISSNRNPCAAEQNGRVVQMNPTYIPRGRINKLKAQEVGHRHTLPMTNTAYQLRNCRTEIDARGLQSIARAWPPIDADISDFRRFV
jgi:hypothetical protein